MHGRAFIDLPGEEIHLHVQFLQDLWLEDLAGLNHLNQPLKAHAFQRLKLVQHVHADRRDAVTGFGEGRRGDGFDIVIGKEGDPKPADKEPTNSRNTSAVVKDAFADTDEDTQIVSALKKALDD